MALPPPLEGLRSWWQFPSSLGLASLGPRIPVTLSHSVCNWMLVILVALDLLLRLGEVTVIWLAVQANLHFQGI